MNAEQITEWLASAFGEDAAPPWHYSDEDPDNPDDGQGAWYRDGTLYLPRDGDPIGGLLHEALHHAFALVRAGRLDEEGEEYVIEACEELAEDRSHSTMT